MLSRVSRAEQQHPKMLASSFALYPQDDNRYRFYQKYFLAGCARGREILVLAAVVRKAKFMEGLLMFKEGLRADLSARVYPLIRDWPWRRTQGNGFPIWLAGRDTRGFTKKASSMRADILRNTQRIR